MLSSSLEYGRSVPARRATSNAAGDSCFRHSSSDFTTRATDSLVVRVPSSLKPMIVTIFGAPAAAASAEIGCRPIDHHQVAPMAAAPAPTRNERRVTTLLTRTD